MSDKPINLLLHQLGYQGMLAQWQDWQDRPSQQPTVWPQAFEQLLQAEWAHRKSRALNYRLMLAKFPQSKSFTDFDVVPPLNPQVLDHLRQFKFIDEHQNVLVIGGSGSGKTHLAIALAYEAVQKGYRVKFYKFTELVRALLKAQAHHYELNFLASLQRFVLLVVDEFGYLPIEQKAGALLFELFSKLYETNSLMLTTHLRFEEWGDGFGNPKATHAMIDRLTHHCYILETGDESWRLKEGKKLNTSS